MDATITRLPQAWHVIGELELVGMLADHARLRCLCTELEHVADALPNPPDRVAVDRVCEQLEQFLPRHHQAEDELLGWLFEGEHSGLARTLLGNIRARHLADQIHAEDLAATLRSIEASRPGNVAELAYMLRCFFDGCRRAMAFEELSVLALAANRLSKDAKEALTASLVANRLRD